MKLKIITASLLTLGLTLDYVSGYPLNVIYLFALIAVIFS